MYVLQWSNQCLIFTASSHKMQSVVKQWSFQWVLFLHQPHEQNQQEQINQLKNPIRSGIFPRFQLFFEKSLANIGGEIYSSIDDQLNSGNFRQQSMIFFQINLTTSFIRNFQFDCKDFPNSKVFEFNRTSGHFACVPSIIIFSP